MTKYKLISYRGTFVTLYKIIKWNWWWPFWRDLDKVRFYDKEHAEKCLRNIKLTKP